MSRTPLVALGLWSAALSSPVLAATTALIQPDCPALTRWAAGLSPGETFSPRPDMQLTTLLRDERAIPLFGRPVLGWERADFDAVMRWLGKCRQEAGRARDQAASKSLYDASKALKASLRPLKGYWGQRVLIERKVDSLVQLRDDPGVSRILGLAERSLHGEDVSAEVSALEPRWQGYGRQAAELAAASDVFSAAEIEGLVGRLEARKSKADSQAAERSEHLQGLLDQIAAVPTTETGLSQLNRIAVQVMQGEQMPQANYDRYNAALQGRRRLIQTQLQQQKAVAAQARATQPAPVQEQLQALLSGDDVDGLSFCGLRPGMDYSRAKALAKSQWDYGEATGGDLFKQFTVTGRQLARYTEEERRDGGMLEFSTMHGKVGEIVYTEHYTGPLDAVALRGALSKRLGEPDQTGSENGVASMQWDDGDQHLKVVAGDRVIKMERSYKGYRSSVQVSLWSQDYRDYLAEAERHCAELRDKPMSELSVNDRQALLMGCKTP